MILDEKKQWKPDPYEYDPQDSPDSPDSPCLLASPANGFTIHSTKEVN